MSDELGRPARPLTEGWCNDLPPIETEPFTGVHKIATYIPITRDILGDMGYIGPLGKDDPESKRWRKLWHESRQWGGVSGWLPFITPPPWESPDPAALPAFTIWRRPWLISRLMETSPKIRTLGSRTKAATLAFRNPELVEDPEYDE